MPEKTSGGYAYSVLIWDVFHCAVVALLYSMSQLDDLDFRIEKDAHYSHDMCHSVILLSRELASGD